MKKILIINGHPDKESYASALAEAYKKGVLASNYFVEYIHIASLDFNPNLVYGYRKRTELEQDLKASIEKIKAADHLVWFFPIWWSGFPAMMKGFIDRAFLPGITYDFEPGKSLPKKLLGGKTARIIVTADTPSWYHSLIMKKPAVNQLKKGVLEYCGVKPVKTSYIATIKGSTIAFRNKWLKKVEKLGQQGL